MSAATRLPALALAGCVALAGACGGGVLGTGGNGGIGHVTGAGGLGALSGSGGALGGAGVAGGIGATGAATGGSIPGPLRAVDILFMIDNSSGMGLAQANLVRNFPTLMTTLRNSPRGLPDMHIAVITSDMGAGDGSISGCSKQGDAGRFQNTPRGACTGTNLAPGATYISDIGGVRNYTGNIEDVFACIAAVGTEGCGFEQPLAAVVHALGADGRQPPPENLGFLRAEALLLIVLVTDEDDCSVPTGSSLFDTTNNLNLASMLGPPTNFRCNEFGHLCNGARPPRRAPTGSVTDTVTLDGCTSAEGTGMLTPVATVVQQLRTLKPDPDWQIMVSAMTGPPTPYVVSWKAPNTSDTSCGAASCPWPAVAHSCTAADGSDADPAVRIAQLVSAFGAGGQIARICSDDYAPLFQTLLARLPPVPVRVP